MKLDQAGRDFIKNFEKLELSVYQDEGGIWTIGWGHIDGVDEYTPDITPEQAEGFFLDDIEIPEKAVTKFVDIYITQNEFNALVSFSFNEGVEAFHTSTLLKKVNAGNRPGAGKEFDRWIYYHDKSGRAVLSAGLVARRSKEKALFLLDFTASRSIA